MIKFLLSLFKPQVDTSGITSDSFKTENPNVAKLREEAKAKMKQWGRKSMLEGGEFSFTHNHVLKRDSTLTRN